MIINTPGHTLFFPTEKMCVDIKMHGRRYTWSGGIFFHQSFQSKGRDFKDPVKSGELTNCYRTGARDGGLADRVHQLREGEAHLWP